MYLALETLPPSLRERIDDLSVKQDITYTAGGQLRDGFTPVTDARVPGRDDPLIRRIPIRGAMRCISDGGATPTYSAWKCPSRKRC